MMNHAPFPQFRENALNNGLTGKVGFLRLGGQEAADAVLLWPETAKIQAKSKLTYFNGETDEKFPSTDLD